MANSADPNETAPVWMSDWTVLGLLKQSQSHQNDERVIMKGSKCNYSIWWASWQNQQNDCLPSEDSDHPGHPPSLITDQSSLCAQWVAKDPSFLQADSEDADQTGRMHSDQTGQMPRLICLRWVHMPCCWFCRTVAHICPSVSFTSLYFLYSIYYRKNPKHLDTWKTGCNHPKIWKRWLFHKVMHPKNADWTAVLSVQKLWAMTWQNQQSECAPSEDSDQLGHPPSLIRVFNVRTKKAWVLSYPLSPQRRL